MTTKKQKVSFENSTNPENSSSKTKNKRKNLPIVDATVEMTKNGKKNNDELIYLKELLI